MKTQLKNNTSSKGQITSRIVSRTANVNFEVGFLLNLGSDQYQLGFALELLKVFETNGKRVFQKLDLSLLETLPISKHLPSDILELLRSMTDEGLRQHLAKDGYSYLLSYEVLWPHLTDNAKRSLRRFYTGQLARLWPWLSVQRHVYFLRQKNFSNTDILPAVLVTHFIQFGFRVEEDAREITIKLQKTENGLPGAECRRIYGGFIFEMDRTLHLPDHLPDYDTLKDFAQGALTVSAQSKERVIRAIIPQLQRGYKVDVPASLLAESIRVAPVAQVLFREMDEKFLTMQPRFDYNGTVVSYDDRPENIVQTKADGSRYIIERDAALEKGFFNTLRQLHPKFEKPTLNNFFFLPFEDTMVDNWFVETVSGLVADNITVLGVQELKKHRYNTNKPQWKISAGSSSDWFDLEIEISFGEQIVSLRDIRKALLKGLKIVTLGDGTFGILPADFLKQYAPLLKMGTEQANGSLRVSKLHYTLLDELPEHEWNALVAKEINEKKQRLQLMGTIEAVQPGKEIKADLRPYQLGGFQWFHMLDELGWGGCLADDMGLGKTLQAISFLHCLKGKYQKSTQLVICPTSLIYNWESELQKFCPSLRYHIYYGTDREFTEAHFADYDVIITSYGIVRNDLEELRQFNWHYIILDESQAIKNPDSLTTKALQLLKSKNRMILSGTPVQNNTFDLFAQFNFINPGLLGNREFFKTEFANPIDKNNDAEKSALLRKLVFPFLLRRTKEQVAKDLPDKTETVLWCNMGREQMAVYNEYKNYYRGALLEKIEEVGMGKAGMDVLEGLLRLRQICDSPALLKDSDVATKSSVKIDELLREIEENTGGHKLLVFSQFTEMLHLLEERLQSASVSYVYLDGSTAAEKRKEAVDRFQGDSSIRVFLISLKAGGVGLNLTAADYVYIVDPWWNPAAEQQAIDRTHRIGQVNKVFAYKMICKDTVEEKILQLQQRKKQLASDLISEDAGFIKKLTKEDVDFLFS